MSYYHPPLENVDVTMMGVLASDVRYVRRTDPLAAGEMRLVSVEAYDTLRTEVERLRAALEQAQAELCADEFDRQGLADYLRGVLWPVPSPGDVR